MQPRFPILSSLVALALVTTAAAQSTTTYVWSPPNCATLAGDGGNTIPFWSASATYQQIHDAPVMPETATTIKGLALRPSSTSIAGRSWDLNLWMGHTSVTSFKASTTFSSNYSMTPTQVVGTSTTWKKFSFPNFSKSGLTPAFTIPLDKSFVYLGALGNFCWEWRSKNGTSTTSMGMDIVSGQATNNKGTTLPSVGTGCTPTGGSSASTASLTSVRTVSSAYHQHLELKLSNAPANVAAFLSLGLNSQTYNIGWCTPVMVPAFLVPGKTDGSGSWTIERTLADLGGDPSYKLYTQYAYADSGHTAGLGLSNVAAFQTPRIPGAHGVSRIYKSTAWSTSNGEESATSGSSTRGYGLVIGLQK